MAEFGSVVSRLIEQAGGLEAYKEEVRLWKLKNAEEKEKQKKKDAAEAVHFVGGDGKVKRARVVREHDTYRQRGILTSELKRNARPADFQLIENQKEIQDGRQDQQGSGSCSSGRD